ncbi:hypothetical protein GDO86_008593 [Hymenochirus boettgeri]|uniref:J domain-containing protein n=1 Tax=Hymenochirus boettgeri TaxID=247094 RepID=A0A8T2J2C1_9PIPI|nr:hypothetical protein GDO86_008593 [Hymenochirus boettgeri]
MMFCRGLSKEGVHLYTTRTKRHRGTYTGSDCQDHYQLLGVGRKATTEEIKNAFFTKSKKLHPDSDPTNPLLHSQFVRLSEAYKVLSRETSRREYDLLLDALQREHWTPGVQSFYHSQYRPPPRTLRDIHNEFMEEQNQRILKIYNEAKERARLNGFRKQQEILRQKHAEFTEKYRGKTRSDKIKK